ncbi:MAG: maltose/moltooligosaccharide transporter, partial [Nocardioidaceae bacterium]|nr:maltose/moltooligosaccharide transporter [Nocardioidaceae bacterium]
ERARYVEQQVVAGDPAQALLDTVGTNPANLIVVGNRGLGANEGQLLGSVPGDVVKNAVCDVLVVQTSALDEERLFAAQPADAGADGGTPLAATDGAGPPEG